MSSEARPLEERLREYGDALLSMSTQIEAVLANLKPAESLAEADARASLQAAADVYRIIGGEDIPKLVAGEELKRWAILSN